MSVHLRGMRNRTRLGLAAIIGATALAVACGDDAKNNNDTPMGGSAGTAAGSGGMAGTPTTGGTAAGTAGTFASGGGGMETGGTGGTTAGTGGTAGGGTGGLGGFGGTPPAIVPTQFLIDNVRLAPKGSIGAGGDGAGGAGFGGAGGDGPVAVLDVIAGAAGMDAGGGAGPTGPLPDFLLTFDTDLQGLAKHPDGFSPGPGGSAGPATLADGTTILWAANVGHPGGAAKFSIPFSKSPLPPDPNAFSQQTDFSISFAEAVDLTGYELTADVKMTDTGDAGDCPTAWMYVYGGNGYANDKSGEPAMGKTSHLVKGEWTKVKLDLDGPYGYHSTANHAFKPLLVQLWGIQFNTWGCAP